MCTDELYVNGTHAHYQRVQELKAKGILLYPHNFMRTHSILDINEAYEGVDGLGEKVLLTLCGRVISIDVLNQRLRVYLEDRDSQLQFMLEVSHMSPAKINLFRDSVTRGDYIGFEVNHIYRSEKGSLTAKVGDWHFLAPRLRRLPDEPQYRLLNDFWARQRIIANSRMLRIIRHFLDDEADCFEVRTPILPPSQHHANGNGLPPFRVSPHLYLMQLIVEGMERVYEICDVFRDVEVDWLHYPELQVLECCIAPADGNDMMNLTERLVRKLAMHLHATDVILWKSREDMQSVADQRTDGGNTTGDAWLISDEQFTEIPIDLTPPWSRRSFYQLVEEATKVDFGELQTVDEALTAARQAGAELADTAQFASIGQVALEVMNQLVTPLLIQPTFVVDYPLELSPASKPYVHQPRLAERAHLFINGLEFASVHSEQTEPPSPPNDRLSEYEVAQLGDDFRQALEYGMPPTGVLELNLNYLAMLMTGADDIRDTILFPTYG